MNPGRLNHPIKLLRRSQKIDAAGSPVEIWTEDHATLWAQEVVAKGSQVSADYTQKAKDSKTLRVHFMSELEPIAQSGLIRVRHKGADFDLVSVNEDAALQPRSYQLLEIVHVQTGQWMKRV